MSILNTMTNEILSAQTLLKDTNISILDAARLIRNALDVKSNATTLSDILFCSNIIEAGKRCICKSEMSIQSGFSIYLETKSHLRLESRRDLKYLGNRLMKFNSKFAKINFSELYLTDCEKWLSETFLTPSQFNKGRIFLHGLFEFAMRREWCNKNIVKLIARKKIVEKEIKPLILPQINKLLHTAKECGNHDCLSAVALLTLAGIRPREVSRLKWHDIDLSENTITVRSICSKTGGVRQVEICPSLKNLLKEKNNLSNLYICPKNWQRRWRSIRNNAGFKGVWIQDILRHTYASYHAKHFRDLPRLQLNMGHRDQRLLHSRYINMSNIKNSDAEKFFNKELS